MKTIDWVKEAKARVKTGHALFGASSLERTSLCAGWVRLAILNNAKSRDTEYTIEGSAAHALGERYMLEGQCVALVDKEIHVLKPGGNWKYVVTPAMARFVQMYIDWCRELPGDHFVETQVNLSIGKKAPLPFQFGTADHACIDIENKILYVTDLKYGMLPVYVEDNPQLLAYALGFYIEYRDLYDIEKIVIRIAQPRLDYFESQELTPEKLLAFRHTMFGWIRAAMEPDPPMKAGKKQCQFCPNSGNCPVEKATAESIYLNDFDAIDDIPTGSVLGLTTQDVVRAYEKLDFIKEWSHAIRKRMFELVANEDTLEYKMVEGSGGQRRWRDEKKAAQFLISKGLNADELYAKKMISANKACELLGRGLMKTLDDEYVVRPPGKALIVPASDTRDRYTPEASDFDDFNETPELEDI